MHSTRDTCSPESLWRLVNETVAASSLLLFMPFSVGCFLQVPFHHTRQLKDVCLFPPAGEFVTDAKLPECT